MERQDLIRENIVKFIKNNYNIPKELTAYDGINLSTALDEISDIIARNMEEWLWPEKI